MERDVEIRRGIQTVRRNLRTLEKNVSDYRSKAVRAKQIEANDQLRGLKDAVAIASELGHTKEAADFIALAASFRETLRLSIRAVIAAKKLQYIPGSVEWADFDPTATSNAVTLLQGMADLPAEQLDGMFDLFVHDFRRKHGGDMPWNNYTAYEIRIIGALVHLGKRAEALELLSSHDWPGNVRELKHVLQRAFILSDSEIGPDALADLAPRRPGPLRTELPSTRGITVEPGTPLAHAERLLILATLGSSGGDKAKTADKSEES